MKYFLTRLSALLLVFVALIVGCKKGSQAPNYFYTATINGTKYVLTPGAILSTDDSTYFNAKGTDTSSTWSFDMYLVLTANSTYSRLSAGIYRPFNNAGSVINGIDVTLQNLTTGKIDDSNNFTITISKIDASHIEANFTGYFNDTTVAGNYITVTGSFSLPVKPN